MNSYNKLACKEAGFTLVELMLAIFIMTVGLMSTVKMMSTFRDAALSSRDQVTALNIGIRKMEDLLGESFYYDFSTSKYVVATNLLNGCHEDPDGDKTVGNGATACYPDNVSTTSTSASATTYYDKFYIGWTCVSPANGETSYTTANNIIDITLTVSWNYWGKTKSVSFRTLKSAS